MDNQQRNQEIAELAYTMGLFLGDGCLYFAKSRGSYQVRFENMDLDTLERAAEEVNRAFGKKVAPRVRTRPSRGDIYELIICSRDCYEWLAFNTRMRSNWPDRFWTLPPEVLKDILIGLMDADGSAEANMQYLTVRLTNTKLDILTGAMAVAKIHGVKFGETVSVDERNPRAAACYRITFNTRDYAQKIGFYCRRKQERIEWWLLKNGLPETIPSGSSEQALAKCEAPIKGGDIVRTLGEILEQL